MAWTMHAQLYEGVRKQDLRDASTAPPYDSGITSARPTSMDVTSV
jgi:hypothetical protein